MADAYTVAVMRAALHEKLDKIDDLKSLRLIKILVDKLIENGSPEN